MDGWPPRAAFAAISLSSLILASCGGAISPTDPASPVATPPASAAPDPSSGVIDPLAPTACLTLGAQDCVRAGTMAASVLDDADPPVVYVQVGPFGCSVADSCPTTLAARPEGDVVIEFPGGAGINVHLVVAADGTFEATRGEPMGIAVDPVSPVGIEPGAVPFTLGHCGILSGIDLDGSWWDPVGPVPMGSGEAVNATAGIMTVTDPNHAAFTTPTGFAIQLQRRAGPKLLPFCM